MSLRQFTVAAVLALATLSTATKEKAPQTPIVGTDTVHGCYKSVGTMTHQNTDNFNSQGACAGLCRSKNFVAGASNSADCWCGDEYPNKADLVDDDQCTEPCPGYGDDACGGLDTYTVYNTGKRVSVGEAAEAGSSSSSSTSSKTSSASAPASTSDTIETITASSEPESNKSSPNVAGIAGGVVVGVVAVGALMGGGFFWMRRKRNAEIEEEHRRNAAVNAFISGGKPPSSSGGVSMSDSRLDPVMNRRMSDGSIADNQDYSRRILRVTNA
ncbi:uncharacterized protein F4807DRAFT_74233 [Annulohypoxylon truncatum]|uniref:uncharacterized protein n=1 Tax=Annulohypoxylon truncatum TaxID=327061 RepID=UPI002008A6B0|nr:uncharacterized protein F4807DRAFT_74233 [Annulohypoxylon truncatum]KAI1210256.1 hypothetical protein F4807DRAFT_74233 [Annulohypoxylon truncatum]